MTIGQAAEQALKFRESIISAGEVIKAAYPEAAHLYASHIEQALNGVISAEAAEAAERAFASISRRAPEHAAIATSTGGDLAVLSLWARGKNVYDIDPDLWSQLGRVDRTKPIPADVFSRLRHTDPFIRLPEPLVIQMAEPGLQARITGFFITGRHRLAEDDYSTVSTHSQYATALGACVGGWVEYQDGRPYFVSPGIQDVLWSRFAIDPADGDGTIDSMVVSTAQRFMPYHIAQDPRAYIEALLPQIMAALIYCCAENADMEPVPNPPVRNKAGRRVKSDRPRCVKVGYRVGKAIQRGRQAYRVAAGGSVPGSGGWTMPPHIRAPHFQRFRCGKGKTEVRVRWVDPVEVNFHLGETMPVGRRVKAPVKSSG